MKVAEVRQKKALQRMIRDKTQLRNTAQFVRRQEKTLAGRIRAAEERLKRYRSSVIAEGQEHLLSGRGSRHASVDTKDGSSSESMRRVGRLLRDESEVREEETRVRARSERERGGDAGRGSDGRRSGGGREGRRSGSRGDGGEEERGGGHKEGLWKSLSSALDRGESGQNVFVP